MWKAWFQEGGVLTVLVADVENKQLKFIERDEDDENLFVFETDEEERLELPKEFFGSKAVFFKGME